MRSRAVILAALLGGFPAAARAGAACALEGRVVDATSGAPVEGAELTLLPGPITAVSATGGRLCVPEIDPGEYEILLVRAGYLAPAPARVLVGGERPAWVDLRLERAPLVERVVVRPQAPPETPPRPGQVPRQDLLHLPGTLDDPTRALTSLPGVAAINDYKGEIRLGGGEPEDTVFLVDGVVIDDPYHFHWSRGSAAGLSVSAFDSISVRTSGLGADVGDTISGVIDLVPSERGAAGGFLDGSLGTLTTSVTSGGSVLGDGSWVASGRYSNLSLYRSLYGVETIEVPDFGDLMFRLRRSVGPGLALVAGGLALANRLQTSDPEDGTWNDVRARSGGAYAGLDLLNDPGLSLSGRLSWSGGQQRYDTSAGDHLDADDSRLRLSVQAKGGDGANPRWSAGVEEAIQAGTIAGALETADNLVPLEARSTRVGAHASLGLRAASAWSSEVGLRVDRDSRFGAAPLEPRLRVEYAARSGWSARFGAGRYAQFPRVEQEFLAQAERLAPAVSDEISAGAEVPLPGGFAAEFAAYERRIRDLTSETVNRFPDLREPMGRFERGRARALELSIHRDQGRLRSRLSAMLLEARQARDGVTSLRNGDQPYLVSLSAAWRSTERWTILGRFQAASGLPYSAMQPQGEGGREIGPLNGERLPAFARLDLRAVWEARWRAARVRAYFEVANALGRRNIRGRDLRWDDTSQRYYFHEEASMPLLPGFGLELSWGGAAGSHPTEASRRDSGR